MRLFAQAERLYAEKGDELNALYAKIGRVRAEVDSMAFPEVSAQIPPLLASLENAVPRKSVAKGVAVA